MDTPFHNLSEKLHHGFEVTFLMKVVTLCVFPLGTPSLLGDIDV